jgi:diguanylate cyclase (GGDEF)-like protein
MRSERSGDGRRSGRTSASIAARLGGWLLLALATAVGALEPQRPVGEFTLKSWDSRGGLPHNSVMALAQTPDGYLWAGTWEGLARWNGSEFAVFDRANTPELQSNGIRALAVGRDGALWVGTARGGLLRYHDRRWQRWSRASGFPFDEIMALHEDARGVLWVGGEEAGLARLDAGGVRVYGEDQGLGHGTVFTIGEGPDGAIYIGHGAGIDRIDGDRAAAWGAARGLPAAPVRSIHFDARGGASVAVALELWRLRDGRFERDPRQDRGLGEVAMVHGDANGDLWLGTIDTGVWRLQGDRVERLGTELGLPQNRVSAWLEDREGSIWIGTSAGLAQLKDLPFVSIDARHGLVDTYVRAMHDAGDGAVWIATSGGLHRLAAQGMQRWSRDEGLPSDSLLSLEVDAGSTLWIGTYGAGVAQMRDGRITAAAGLAELDDRQVRALLETRDGSLWIGTNMELARWRDGELRRYTMQDGLPRNYVMALAEAPDGRLWIGTSNGLASFDGERFERYDASNGFPGRDVFTIHVQADGALWLGTGVGLVRMREGRFAPLDVRRGLPHDSIFQVLDDGLGHLWMCTNKGAFRVPRAELEHAADAPGLMLDPLVFGRLEGMSDTQCNGGSQPAAVRMPDGRLWFSTAAGASAVNPSRQFDAPTKPTAVALERVLVDGAMHVPASGTALDIPSGPHKLELHYAGLNLSVPERVRYRHRLVGFDPDWVRAGSGRLAVYGNLAPGAYRFEVEASSGGPWSERPAVVEVRVVPQYWQTTGFRLLMAAALAVLLWGMMRWRVGRVQASERRLTALVQARTSDLAEQAARLAAADREKSQLLEALRQQAEALARLASEDALTGLPNRRAFDERLALAFERARREQSPLAVALADIDQFKAINDTWSHAAGDAVLRALADLLRRHASSEVFVSRYGGEEFALLFTGQAALEATPRCEALRRDAEAIDLSAMASNLVLHLSIGVVRDDGSALHHEKLLSAADERLYEAKRAGRNRVVSERPPPSAA